MPTLIIDMMDWNQEYEQEEEVWSTLRRDLHA